MQARDLAAAVDEVINKWTEGRRPRPGDVWSALRKNTAGSKSGTGFGKVKPNNVPGGWNEHGERLPDLAELRRVEAEVLRICPEADTPVNSPDQRVRMQQTVLRGVRKWTRKRDTRPLADLTTPDPSDDEFELLGDTIL